MINTIKKMNSIINFIKVHRYKVDHKLIRWIPGFIKNILSDKILNRNGFFYQNTI